MFDTILLIFDVHHSVFVRFFRSIRNNSFFHWTQSSIYWKMIITLNALYILSECEEAKKKIAHHLHVIPIKQQHAAVKTIKSPKVHNKISVNKSQTPIIYACHEHLRKINSLNMCWGISFGLLSAVHIQFGMSLILY